MREALKSDRSVILFCAGKAYGLLRDNGPIFSKRLLGRNRNRQTLPATGATTLDDRTAVLGLHPLAKTVGPFAADAARLISTFHDN